MFKNIMVPSDGSKYSDKAENIAIDLASKINAKVIAIHVIDESLLYPYNVLEDEGNKILSKITEKGRKKGVEVVEHLITGDPLRDMKVIAKKANADSIVISPNGKNSLEKIVFGSVADRVIKTFDIPVIIVK
jgi:nucleotide-binding universal stress UspA family protein